MKFGKPALIELALTLSLLASSCSAPTPAPTGGEDILQLTILYTDDEHGWMEGEEPGQGAANLLGLWREEHNYGQDSSVILLSGGDNWTGPAISTWFQGQSMVEVMNAIGYAASVIGNHEFDFGLDAMQTRLSEADFPYISANMRYISDNSVPTQLGIHPYTILEVGELKVGVIGLTTTSTPYTTNPANIREFEFMDYEKALRQFVPKMRTEGAELILLASHICPDELTSLAARVKDLDIPFMGGGHCHQQTITQIGDTVIATSGSNLTGYAYIQLAYDPQAKTSTILDHGVRANQGGVEDSEVAAIIDKWREETDAELNVEIGYLEKKVSQKSPQMQALITESWLHGYPTADVALTNLGGMRADLGQGEVTIAGIIGVMPFDNVLVAVQMTGAQLLQTLDVNPSPLAVGGMHKEGREWIIDKTGQPLDTGQSYSVLVNDFMYAGGDNYGLLAEFDPDAYDTTIDWRQPVIDWILAQGSSPEKPLDPAVNALVD